MGGCLYTPWLVYLFLLVTCMWSICTGVFSMYVYIVKGCGWGVGWGDILCSTFEPLCINH